MFQTRSENSGIVQWETLKDAMKAAEKDDSIWKISFSVGKERVRLVRQTLYTQTRLPVVWWVYESISLEVRTT